jgi:hypothetical protein
LLLAVPSLIDHACTTLDVLFMAAAVWTWWCALLAFRPGARAHVWVLLGVLLYACTLLSFSAFPLGLAIFFLALVRGRAMLLRLLVVGASYAAAAWLFFAATGFAMWECLHEARTHAEVFMSWRIDGTARATWAYRTYGNLAAFLIGGGVALVPALAVRLAAPAPDAPGGTRATGFAAWRADGWTIVALLTLVVMTFAPIYYMETERIWIFAYPWLAASAVARGGFDTASLRRLCVAGLGQSLAMEALHFTFW